MNEERNKFLTEKVLGKCWHGREILEMESIICSKCGWPITQGIDFDSWQGFGELWPVVIKKEWWPEFMVVQSTAKEKCGLSVIQFLNIFINPPIFATAVYEFFLH